MRKSHMCDGHGGIDQYFTFIFQIFIQTWYVFSHMMLVISFLFKYSHLHALISRNASLLWEDLWSNPLLA